MDVTIDAELLTLMLGKEPEIGDKIDLSKLNDVALTMRVVDAVVDEDGLTDIEVLATNGKTYIVKLPVDQLKNQTVN